MNSGSARLVVCEKAGGWAFALRRCLARDVQPAIDPEVVETRSLSQCWQELLSNPSSAVLVEATPANLDQLPDWLLNLTRRFPAAMAIVVARRELKPYRLLLREAGATFVLFSPRQIQFAARLARRHLASIAPPKRSFRQQILDRLPWG